jgi:NADPH:quinone reductase-like Zn-dependent oxidoreductase
MITTDAWVLYAGRNGKTPTGLVQERICLHDLQDEEILVEPLYGCWEANMAHALARKPVDICQQRGEEKVVLGNAATVRVLQCGRGVDTLREGDLCLLFCNGCWDQHGYPVKIFGYDAPGSIGVLAKRTKVHYQQLIKIPANSKHDLRQWAAFSLRYITAWANWRVAMACWHSQAIQPSRECWVWGWGGGVAFAEVTLAKHFGFRAAQIASIPDRLALLRDFGVVPVDRSDFGALNFDENLYNSDPGFHKRYQEAEQAFLAVVSQITGDGVSIFVDLIGMPVYRATLKALRRPGVITTSGWKLGMSLYTLRALECMNWHTHVHTHYARKQDGEEAVAFAEHHGWLPPVPEDNYGWDDIPSLASEYTSGQTRSYFPMFVVNAL